MVTLLTLLLVAPPMAAWAARNQAVLGKPVLMRDNIGLELSLKNNDDVLRNGLGNQVQARSNVRIHPGEPGSGRRRLQQIGEMAYLEELKRQSYAWIAAYPGAFGRIAVFGFLQNLFPPSYQFDSAGALRRAVIWTVDAIGLLTFAAMILRRRPGWPSVAISTVLISAAYAPFVYQWRYHYPVYNLLLFAAASGVWACCKTLLDRRSGFALAR